MRIVEAKRTIDSLIDRCFSIQINWHKLLGGLFPLEPRPHDVFLVHDPTYMRKLGRIISLFGKK